MGSTGEADKKRRHFSSMSPTAATAKKHTFVPLSEEKKLDAAVLQFQNQKLLQKMETQKIEITALTDRLGLLKDKQKLYPKILNVVKNSWEELVDYVDSRSDSTKNSLRNRQGFKLQILEVGADCSSPPEEAFLSRLMDTGATQSSSATPVSNLKEDDRQTDDGKSKSIMRNIIDTLDRLNIMKNRLYSASMETFSSSDPIQKVFLNLQSEVKDLRTEVFKLHLKHKSLATELQGQSDTEAMNKADLKRLKGELENTVTDLEKSNRSLAILKAESDVARNTVIPILNCENKQSCSDTEGGSQRDLHGMEFNLEKLLEQSSSRLQDLKRLHDDRLGILWQLSILQSNLKNVKFIFSSQPYLMLKDQLSKTKSNVFQYQALYAKLQVEKDTVFWREKESHLKTEFFDVLCRSSAVLDSRISDLESEIQRCISEKVESETKLEDAIKQPGRKEIIAEFKTLVSSFPEKMGNMQMRLIKHKEVAADIHSLRADVQSLKDILDCKAKELDTLTSRSVQQISEIKKLKAVIDDLEVAKLDLKLFLEMYGYEANDSREVSDARNSAIKGWARVQSLKSSLDEQNLERRVKVAIEAEAKVQQRLAASEAEIAELRQKLGISCRDKSRLSGILKSKQEEIETYLSEIETIGQAYDDMQTQNQQLLQQITERDDYNLKLVLEGVQARQREHALLMEKQTLDIAVHQTKTNVDFYNLKSGRIEDQLKAHSVHIQKLVGERDHNATNVENLQKRLSGVRNSLPLMDTIEGAQSQADRSRTCVAELQMELEKERFGRKRVEEQIETLRTRAEHLNKQADSSTSKKLRQELSEYKEILKCSVCLDRRKEVVITKCYHLFCSPCVQRIMETRHRKCPLCSASFGANDVKPVYI